MGWWSEQVVPRAADVVLSGTRVDALRRRVCAGLAGDVVEIGFGSGRNVPHYPAAVTSVTAVEPSDVAWSAASERVRGAGPPVRRTDLDAQGMTLDDASVDAALSTFTLCSIPDLGQALAELHRVVRPGGALHFVEHGLAPDRSVAAWQHRLTPVQRRVAAGCHLDRDIAAELEGHGWRLVDVETFYGFRPRVGGYLYLGRAARA